MTPVSDEHSGLHTAIVLWLGEFGMAAPGTAVRIDPTVILGPRSEPQPDACLRVAESYGGKSRIVGGYLHGAPELVVEIAVSSRPHDLSEKKADYEQAGVEEYVVVLPERQQVLWFRLVDGVYKLIEPDVRGILRSRRFPGLWLEPVALFGGDLQSVRRTLQEGLASAEHQVWTTEMRKKGP